MYNKERGRYQIGILALFLFWYVCLLSFILKTKSGEKQPFSLKEPFEIYLSINDGVSPLCNTEGVCGTIKDAVDKLYEEIQQSAGRIHISDVAVEAIYKYLNGSDV